MDSCSFLAPVSDVKSFSVAAEISRHSAAASRMSSNTDIFQGHFPADAEHCLQIMHGSNPVQRSAAGCIIVLKMKRIIPYCKRLISPLPALQDVRSANTVDLAKSAEKHKGPLKCVESRMN